MNEVNRETLNRWRGRWNCCWSGGSASGQHSMLGSEPTRQQPKTRTLWRNTGANTTVPEEVYKNTANANSSWGFTRWKNLGSLRGPRVAERYPRRSSHLCSHLPLRLRGRHRAGSHVQADGRLPRATLHTTTTLGSSDFLHRIDGCSSLQVDNRLTVHCQVGWLSFRADGFTPSLVASRWILIMTVR